MAIISMYLTTFEASIIKIKRYKFPVISPNLFLFPGNVYFLQKSKDLYDMMMLCYVVSRFLIRVNRAICVYFAGVLRPVKI